jgi:hypothetical protein
VCDEKQLLTFIMTHTKTQQAQRGSEKRWEERHPTQR